MSKLEYLKNRIRQIVKEVKNDLEEETTTSSIDGYQTPNAFSDDSDEERRKNIAKQLGYTIVDDDVDNISEAEQYKPWRIEVTLLDLNPREFASEVSKHWQRVHKVKVVGSNKDWIITSLDKNGSSSSHVVKVLSRLYDKGDIKFKEINFESISEGTSRTLLDEKLITYGNRKPYGQVVFLAGGAASGKGFAVKNFLDSSSFKVRDVDEMKKQIQKLNQIGKLSIDDIVKKYGSKLKGKDLELIQKIQDEGYTLKDLNLKNGDHVYALHMLVDAMGLKEKSLESLLVGKNNPETLPNIMFDITAKQVTDITGIIPMLKEVGYSPNNVHLTWVLTNYATALENNKTRDRFVPEDILLKTHEGAGNTMWGLITKALPSGMNGRVDVVLNNPQNTIIWTTDDGKQHKGAIGGFISLPVKKAGGGIFPESEWKKILYRWIKENGPKSITANMTESVNESKFNGNLSGDVAEYIANELSHYVKGIIDQSNRKVTYLHLKDKSYKGKVIKTLKDIYGLNAKDGGILFSPSPTVVFSNNEILESKINEGRKPKGPVNRWLELKNDDSMHANKKLAIGLKELKYQLTEIEKFFNWYNKIKNINELDSDNYWKRTNRHIYKIKERLINIAHTIKEIEK